MYLINNINKYLFPKKIKLEQFKMYFRDIYSLIINFKMLYKIYT